MATSHRRFLIGLVVLLLGVCLCGGCSEQLKYHEIYMSGVAGGVVGAIVGHQSDECGAGAVIGAAVFATGDLLCQTDRINERKVKEAAEKVARGDSLLDPMRREP
jgi:hypothetical protein